MGERVENMLRRIAQDQLAEKGLELLDVEFKSGALRVTLDSDSPLDLDRIAEASAVISRLIDASQEFDEIGQFNLEVSSPGIERTLRTEAHFKRHIGSKINVKTKADYEGPRRFAGVVESVNDGSIAVRVDDSYGLPVSELEVRLEEIERARTVFEWGSQNPPKGKAGGGSKKANRRKMTANKLGKG